jgi:tetratricopeptide (TPR) repeat protein
MKKIISLFYLVLAIQFSFSQSLNDKPTFNVNYFDAKDKWVIFPKKDTDSIYPFGFIYLDLQAGFTLNYEGNVVIDKNGKFKLYNKNNDGFTKVRLEPYKTANVFIIPDKIIEGFKLSAKPDWLAIYEPSSPESIQTLKDFGYHYNHVGACEKALTFLEKAYKINPHFDGLEFELAYAYNHLGLYEKAIPILDKAISNNPKNYYFFRELGFAYVKQNKIDLAEKTYSKGIKMSDNDFEKSEMALNMTQGYFKSKNRKKFDEWSKITRKYAEPNSQYAQYIDMFEKEWDSPR